MGKPSTYHGERYKFRVRPIIITGVVDGNVLRYTAPVGGEDCWSVEFERKEQHPFTFTHGAYLCDFPTYEEAAVFAQDCVRFEKTYALLELSLPDDFVELVRDAPRPPTDSEE